MRDPPGQSKLKAKPKNIRQNQLQHRIQQMIMNTVALQPIEYRVSYKTKREIRPNKETRNNDSWNGMIICSTEWIITFTRRK